MMIPFALSANQIDQVPVSFKGRIRPLEIYAQLWLYDLYHSKQIKKEDREAFHLPHGKASDLVWQLHFKGHDNWDDAPLFYIHSAEIKSLMGHDPKDSRYSYHKLSKKVRLLADNKEKKLAGEIATLLESMSQFASIQTTLEISSTDIIQGLRNIDSSLKLLPGRYSNGEWFSLKALKAKVYNSKHNQLEDVGNFTAYSDKDFIAIKVGYLALEKAFYSDEGNLQTYYDDLAESLMKAYTSLKGTSSTTTNAKALFYPTVNQLKMELLYYQYPFTEITIALYFLGALLLWLGNKKQSFFSPLGMVFLVSGFLLHTLILAMRCYILGRPPVSNMFETVIYVPWIAILTGFFMHRIYRQNIIIIASAIASIILLVLLKITNLNSGMENVQAVLDSQYWLIIHVLMIVGSYGVFVLNGVIAHIYLLNPTNRSVGNLVLQTMYLGLALLIPGTILGGVWAAESWGRFWDWDPKESWAFISASIYLIWVHAYNFNHVGYFGLSVGAITGLLAISFTWYGVNYILGTGFHSYGFGSGGEFYYFSFIAAEVIFLLWVLKRSQEPGVRSF